MQIDRPQVVKWTCKTNLISLPVFTCPLMFSLYRPDKLVQKKVKYFFPQKIGGIFFQLQMMALDGDRIFLLKVFI